MADQAAAKSARPWSSSRSRSIATRFLLGAAVAITAMCTALFIGMRLDDRRIEAHLASATATVISVSALHTGIEFVDSTGVTIRPADGVLYPGLLDVGQQFVVEYDTEDPTVVRVAGRTAAVGNLVVATTMVGTWVVAGGLLFWLRRPPRTRKERIRKDRNRKDRLKPDGRRPQQEDSSASTSSTTSGTDTTSPASGKA